MHSSAKTLGEEVCAYDSDPDSNFTGRYKLTGEYSNVVNVPWSLGLSSFADERM